MLSLGEKIATFRKQRGMTQEQLAEKCSVSAQAVSKWENDLTAPDIALLPRLSELFGVTIDELLGVQRADVVAVDKATVDVSKLLLKIRIISDDGDKVNVNFPLSVAEILLKNGAIIKSFGSNNSDALKGVDFEQIITLVKEGAVGKLVDIESADGDKVEIWVE